jgi:hypothetical protein
MTDEPNFERDAEDVVKAFVAKGPVHTRFWHYYEEDHQLVFSTEKIKEAFGSIISFCENWLSVVVSTPLDRLNLLGFTSPDKAVSDKLNELFDAMHLAVKADAVHESMLVTGEGFLVADSVNEKLNVYYNDPRNVHVVYDADDPETPSYASKWWQTRDGKIHLNLYYPDKILSYEYAAAMGAAAKLVELEDVKKLGTPTIVDNPFETIPVFHFRSGLRRITSCFKKVIPIQQAIDKQFADMMVSSEFNSFHAWWSIGNFDSTNTAQKLRPGRYLEFPAAETTNSQATQVGTFPASDPGLFTKTLEHLVQSLATISGTPQHYFLPSTNPPSGEALYAQESPLIAKVMRYISILSPEWCRLAQFISKHSELKKDIMEADVDTIFAPLRKGSAMITAQTRASNTQAGMPLQAQLRDEGYREDEIEKIMQEQAEEQGAAAARDAKNASAGMTEVDEDEGTEPLSDSIEGVLPLIAEQVTQAVLNSPEIKAMLKKNE